MTRRFSTLLVVTGLLIVLATLFGQWYTSYRQKKLIEQWNNFPEYTISNNSTESLQQKDSGTDSGNKGPIKTPAISEADSNKNSAESSIKLLGKIIIKKINVDVPIIEGVSKEDLSLGAGHFTGTALPGAQGNCAIAGHRSYTFGRFFNRLNEIKKDDEIIIKTKEKDYVYRVYERMVVKPQDTWVLRGSKKETILTLITCEPIYVATHRLIIRAKLIE